MVSLGDLADVMRMRVQPRDYPDMQFIGMDAIEAHTMRLLHTVPASTMNSSAEHFFPNDVLYGRMRPYLNKVFKPDFEGLCSGEFIVFRKQPHLESKYLQYFLNSWEFVSFASHQVEGDRPRIGFDQMAGYEFPLAPLAEQQRIVDVIEAQFTRLDAAVEALRRVQANLKRYRASVLKAACEGRLVPTEAELAAQEGRTCEPASVLLARILAERRAQWEAEDVGKQYALPTLPDVADLPDIPNGWAIATMDQLTQKITSGSRGWKKYYSASGAQFIRAQDINTDELRLEAVAHVNLPNSAEGIRTKVFLHDLLVTITGANVTKTALVRLDLDDAYVSQHVALVRPVDSSVSPYLYSWIISPANGRKALENEAYGAGKPGLNLTNLRELLVALPPLEEQHRINSEIERVLSVVDSMETAIEASFSRSERLRQAILKRAFEGKLVPQDANDEPASELLKRIRLKQDKEAD